MSQPVALPTAPNSRTAGALVPDASRIAVLRANALGDFIAILPALDALRAAYPAAEIALIGQPWHEDFLDGRPGPIDRVVALPPGLPHGNGPAPDADAERDAIGRLAALRPDIALQLQGGGRTSNPLILRTGADVVAGARTPDSAMLDRWIHYEVMQPEVTRALEIVGLVGAAPVGLEPILWRRPADAVAVARELSGLVELDADQDRPIVVLHPGATDPRRRWPAERFAKVGDALADAGARVVVTGVAEEAPITRDVVEAMGRPGIDLAGRLSLGGLAGLLERAALVVSNDTGPRHLAGALGRPTVGIYWCGNVINAGPMFRDRHRVLISWRLDCPACGRNCIREGCSHSDSFVADVPVSGVIEAALDLLGRGSDRHAVAEQEPPDAIRSSPA